MRIERKSIEALIHLREVQFIIIKRIETTADRKITIMNATNVKTTIKNNTQTVMNTVTTEAFDVYAKIGNL
jgi:hypothetical protein